MQYHMRHLWTLAGPATDAWQEQASPWNDLPCIIPGYSTKCTGKSATSALLCMSDCRRCAQGHGLLDLKAETRVHVLKFVMQHEKVYLG